jgi:hypothetical protein
MPIDWKAPVENVTKEQFETNNPKCKETSYENVCFEFEEKHAKIIDKAIYIKECDNNDVIIMSEKKLMSAYKHMIYTDIKIDKVTGIPFIIVCNFIKKWTTNNPLIILILVYIQHL